jgi:hypothetical protein
MSELNFSKSQLRFRGDWCRISYLYVHHQLSETRVDVLELSERLLKVFKEVNKRKVKKDHQLVSPNSASFIFVLYSLDFVGLDPDIRIVDQDSRLMRMIGFLHGNFPNRLPSKIYLKDTWSLQFEYADNAMKYFTPEKWWNKGYRIWRYLNGDLREEERTEQKKQTESTKYVISRCEVITEEEQIQEKKRLDVAPKLSSIMEAETYKVVSSGDVYIHNSVRMEEEEEEEKEIFPQTTDKFTKAREYQIPVYGVLGINNLDQIASTNASSEIRQYYEDKLKEGQNEIKSSQEKLKSYEEKFESYEMDRVELQKLYEDLQKNLLKTQQIIQEYEQKISDQETQILVYERKLDKYESENLEQQRVIHKLQATLFDNQHNYNHKFEVQEIKIANQQKQIEEIKLASENRTAELERQMKEMCKFLKSQSDLAPIRSNNTTESRKIAYPQIIDQNSPQTDIIEREEDFGSSQRTFRKGLHNLVGNQLTNNSFTQRRKDQSRSNNKKQKQVTSQSENFLSSFYNSPSIAITEGKLLFCTAELSVTPKHKAIDTVEKMEEECQPSNTFICNLKLSSLNKNQFIDDLVIAVYIQQKYKEYFNDHFYLFESSAVQVWINHPDTLKINKRLWERKTIFIPFNTNGDHWSLLIFDEEATKSMAKFLFLDSFKHTYPSNIPNFVAAMLNQAPPNHWIARTPDVHVVNVPIQPNKVDCGLFCVENMEQFIQNRQEYIQQLNIPNGIGRNYDPLCISNSKRHEIKTFLEKLLATNRA